MKKTKSYLVSGFIRNYPDESGFIAGSPLKKKPAFFGYVNGTLFLRGNINMNALQAMKNQLNITRTETVTCLTKAQVLPVWIFSLYAAA